MTTKGRWGFGLTCLVVATLLMWWTFRGFDWPAVWRAMAGASAAWLFVALACNSTIIVLWAAAWQLLVPDRVVRPSFKRMLEINAFTSSLANTLPAWGGHASGVVLLAERGGLGGRAAVSLMALDQLGEGLSKLALFAVVALSGPLPSWMNRAMLLLLLGVSGLLIGLFIVPKRWATDLSVLRNGNRSLLALACFIGMKAVETLAIMAVQRSFGVALPPTAALLILALVSLATMLPLAPGNVGPYEGAVLAGYTYLGVAPETALALAIVQHVCFLAPAIGLGYATLFAQQVRAWAAGATTSPR